jgi:hypothetical protein
MATLDADGILTRDTELMIARFRVYEHSRGGTMKTLAAFCGMFAMFMSGCGTSNIAYGPWYEFTNDQSPRSEPARISTVTNWDSLNRMGYARIGGIANDVAVFTEWYDDDYYARLTERWSDREKDLANRPDLIEEVCREAAANGGDLVTLERRNWVDKHGLSKQGRPVSSRITGYSNEYNPDGSIKNTTTSRDVVYSTIVGAEYHLVTQAQVWRHDPALAKLVAEADRPEKEKKLEAEKKEENRRIALLGKDYRVKIAEMKKEFKALEKKYREPTKSDSVMANRRLHIQIGIGLPGLKYGFADSKGNIVIEPQFESANEFSEGLALVELGGHWVYVNETGSVAIQIATQDAQGFSEGLAPVKVRWQWGFIDKTGALVIQPQFESADQFSEGLACVKVKGKHGFIDKKGRSVIKPQFGSAKKFRNGIAEVTVDNWLAYVNKAGVVVINPQSLGILPYD